MAEKSGSDKPDRDESAQDDAQASVEDADAPTLFEGTDPAADPDTSDIEIRTPPRNIPRNIPPPTPQPTPRSSPRITPRITPSPDTPSSSSAAGSPSEPPPVTGESDTVAEAEEAQAGLKLPKEIGGYQITRILGMGGMSVVYGALQKQPRRPVALKVMKSDASAERALHRFRREVEILGRLNHPCIAQVYDAGTHDDGTVVRPFFVMEYVPSAKTILQYADDKDLSLEERLKLFVKVCAAIEHGHRNKIVHRDLKPSNILIDISGMPKIIDFGVARALELDVTSQTMQTEVGRLVGTVQYMSPEQVNAGLSDIDTRSDVYSLGVLMYKFITGRHPYNLEGLPVFTAVQMICEVMPPRPCDVRPDLPGDLETILLKAMEKDRFRRYRTAGSLGRDLVRFLAHKPINARRASLGYRSRLLFLRHRTLFLSAAAVLLITGLAAVIVMGSFSAMQKQSEQAQAELDDIQNSLLSAQLAADEAERKQVEAGRRPIVFDQHTAGIVSLRFDGSGRFLASGSNDHGIMLLDIENEEVKFVSRIHEAPPKYLAFCLDGTRLIAAADDQVVSLFDTSSGELLDKLYLNCGRLMSMAVSPDGRHIAYGCDDLTLWIFDLETNETSTVRGTTGAFISVTFSPDGSHIFAGSEGGTVYQCDVESGSVLRRFESLTQPVMAIGVTEDDGRIIAIDRLGNVVDWSLTPPDAPDHPDAIRRFTICAGEVKAVAFDPARRYLVCVTDDEVRIRNLTTGDNTRIKLEDARSVVALAIDTQRKWVATGDSSGQVKVIPIPSE